MHVALSNPICGLDTLPYVDDAHKFTTEVYVSKLLSGQLEFCNAWNSISDEGKQPDIISIVISLMATNSKRSGTPHACHRSQ